MSTCENVRCWHVECWHVKMWDVDMWKYENILCWFSMDLRMYVQSQQPMDLRTCIAWCQLYKVYENAWWCQHRECMLHMTGWWVFRNLRLCTCCIWLDVGYTQTWECACAMYDCMLDTHELANMHALSTYVSRCWLVNASCICTYVEYARDLRNEVECEFCEYSI